MVLAEYYYLIITSHSELYEKFMGDNVVIFISNSQEKQIEIMDDQ